VGAQRGCARGYTGADPRLHARDEVKRHVALYHAVYWPPLLTRNSPGHAIRAAPLPPHVRHQRLAQLCAELLQGRLRRYRPVQRRRTRHRVAANRAIGTIEPACPLQCRNTDVRQTLCSILKWCWSRLPGGVVTWDVYELFRIGEAGESRALEDCSLPFGADHRIDSNLARHAFDTFIPLSVDSEARKRIIFDFFDLLSAVAARGKTNGMGGRKLSRLAGWWAFEFVEDGKGFDGGYRTWEK
jgi:hypothetical protein